MARGISIHIGLNSVNTVHYQGWSGVLNACESDAKDMALIARARGFESTLLLTTNATRTAIASAITDAAAQLRPGDICLLTYSGHGGTLPDRNGDEDDGLDETWCLYDGQIVDDEIYGLLSTFSEDVRVLVVADSCHSGSSIKDIALYESYVNPLVTYRAMPPDVTTRVYLANKAFYDPILDEPALAKARGDVVAACLLISGCQDNQLSGDGPFNGVFTGRLKVVWNGGKFSGDYVAFWKAIKKSMPRDQTPNLFSVGHKIAEFEKQSPFTI